VGVAPLKAVFFDRDGVLNRVVFHDGNPGSPRLPEELRLTDGAAEALARLKDAGFMLICATNQPELARGTLRPEALEAINAELQRHLPLDEILVCPHEDAAGCECRKPKPGLLTEAARRRQIDLAASWMVGDRWRDVEAGANAGCRTIMVESEHHDRPPSIPPDRQVSSLKEAAEWILTAGAAPAQASVLD